MKRGHASQTALEAIKPKKKKGEGDISPQPMLVAMPAADTVRALPLTVRRQNTQAGCTIDGDP